jgi:hypothetical protein
VRESDRPIAERVSVLDRPATDADLPREHYFQGGLAGEVDISSVRLALVFEDLRVWVGLGTRPESLFLMSMGADGGGSCIGPRSTLSTHGATRMGNGSRRGHVLVGIVSDLVTGVLVDGLFAELGDNVYVARARIEDEVVLTLIGGGERTLPPVLRPSPTRAQVNRVPGPTRSLGT